ncbi:MAG TPA: molybdopterin cofactor-binding domain-containing protein [Xanthobacteraceae bacterium]|nr:molybdopterin cofactor-binding domain-containing protein [Xanthobacteraceae bacterium]
MSRDGAVRVRRVVCAVDCGTVVNPDTVHAQIQSAVIFDITAALYGQITLKDGRIEQSNFDSYQMLRMNEAPAIEGYIIQSSEPPGGMGEAGTSAIVPTVTNAIFAATGKRLRKLPIDPIAAGVNGIPSLRPENRRGGLNCLEQISLGLNRRDSQRPANEGVSCP